MQYNGLYPEDGPVPEWMTTNFQLWYRNPRKVIHNILTNPALADSIDYIPYRELENGKRCYCDFMSGNWAWTPLALFTHVDLSPIGSYFC